MTHRPSGSMCAVCAFKGDEFKQFCGSLNFTAMQKIKSDKDGTIVVKCIEFRKATKFVEHCKKCNCLLTPSEWFILGNICPVCESI